MRGNNINNNSFSLIMNWWLLPWCSGIGFQKISVVWCSLVCSLKLFSTTNSKLWGKNYTLRIRSRYHRREHVFRIRLMKKCWVNDDLQLNRFIVFTGCREHRGWMLKASFTLLSPLIFSYSIWVSLYYILSSHEDRKCVVGAKYRT